LADNVYVPVVASRVPGQKGSITGSPAAAAFNRGTVVDVVAPDRVVVVGALAVVGVVVAVVVEVDVELFDVVDVEEVDADVDDEFGAAAA
jgi:hypothetical protein